MDENAFRLLVRHADRKNRTSQIGGYLSYMCPVFFQFLEGPSEDVLDLMRAIQDDARHKVLTVTDMGEDEASILHQCGVISDYSQRRINPILERLLQAKDAFIYGDDQQRIMTLNMVKSIIEHKALMDEVEGEHPGPKPPKLTIV